MSDYIKGYISRASAAQKVFETWPQNRVDEAVRLVGRVVFENAEILAEMSVTETGMGNIPDKILKNRGKPSIIWSSLKGKKSRGIISRNETEGIVEIAKPVGIVAAVTPCTNPIVTPMCNAMFALKGGNAIIFTPHHRSKNCSTHTVNMINEKLAEIGVPENLIQILSEQSRDNTRELMAQSDVVVATGGMGMVKAAYSSGTPAFGVGAGNVQCIIGRDADLSSTVSKIITGRCFDNGIICSGEQTVIVHKDDAAAVMAEFSVNSAYVANVSETEVFRSVVFPEGKMNGDLVGQPASKVATMAGVEVPEGTRLILLPTDSIGRDDVLSKEKMCPVMSVYKYSSFNEAVGIAEANLEYEGAGHSVSIHTDNISDTENAALKLNVSRFVINQTCSTSAGGSFFNGFAPTTTLGCGSWGNNSISENLSYKHLMNVSRIGYFMADNKVPNEDELWGCSSSKF